MNSSSVVRAGLELLALTTVGWLINTLIEPDPPGVNVIRFGVKWFVYTYAMAAIILVLIPFLAVLVVGLVVSGIAARKVNAWQLYRYAFIGASVWTMLGNYGLWYGKSRQAHNMSATLPAVAGQTFSPPGCEFTVVFPSEPEMTSVVVPGFGEVPEAGISDGGGVMRAICISASSEGSVEITPYYQDRQLLARSVREYADLLDLNDVSYFHDNTDLGIRASARGRKQFEGRWVTYETVWFVSPRSVMWLTAGHVSESYPTQEISRFLDSVTRADRSANVLLSERIKELVHTQVAVFENGMEQPALDVARAVGDGGPQRRVGAVHELVVAASYAPNFEAGAFECQ